MWVQFGLAPVDFKPKPAVGAGVCEIRVRLGGAWRMIYVAKFADAIYVLHACQKKTQKTAKNAIGLAAKRHKLIGDRAIQPTDTHWNDTTVLTGRQAENTHKI